MSDEKKISLAALAALLLHALLFVVFALGAGLFPRAPLAEAEPAPTPKPIEINVVEADLLPLKPATPTPAPKMADTEGLAESQQAPENPLFESDINSVAGTDMPANGDAPAPSQEGKERRSVNFRDQQYTVGRTDRPPSPPVMNIASLDLRDVSPVTPTPTPSRKPDRIPDSTPAPTPSDTPRPERDVFARPTPRPVVKTEATPLPTATPTPPATPTPAATATPGATPTPKPSPSPTRLAMFKPTPVPQSKTPPKPQPADPGYQPEREMTRIEGSISNRGPRGIDAIGTPLGRYRKVIADAVGSRWYYYINRRMDLITVGSTRIRFFVNERGAIQDVKVLSNTANDTFAGFSVQSIIEAKIPPPPSELTDKLDNNRLEIEYTFTIYPN